MRPQLRRELREHRPSTVVIVADASALASPTLASTDAAQKTMDHHEPAPTSADDDKKKEHSHGHGHSHEHSEDAAKIVGLGTVTLGGSTYMIDRDGQVACGGTTEFGVELVSGTAVPSLGWLANPCLLYTSPSPRD